MRKICVFWSVLIAYGNVIEKCGRFYDADWLNQQVRVCKQRANCLQKTECMNEVKRWAPASLAAEHKHGFTQANPFPTRFWLLFTYFRRYERTARIPAHRSIPEVSCHFASRKRGEQHSRWASATRTWLKGFQMRPVGHFVNVWWPLGRLSLRPAPSKPYRHHLRTSFDTFCYFTQY